MSLLGRPAIIVWLIGLLACAAAITRTHVATDMSAFLPRAISASSTVARTAAPMRVFSIASHSNTPIASAMAIMNTR